MSRAILLKFKVYFTMLLLVGLLSPAAAQQQEEPAGEIAREAPEEAAAAETAAVDATEDAVPGDAAEDDSIVLDDPENADLDEQTYEEDEDDFIPTEEIPADEPIPFPSNI